MIFILRIFKHYCSYAIILGLFVCGSLMLAAYFYHITKTDLALINSITEDFHSSVLNDQNLPYGWTKTAYGSCESFDTPFLLSYDDNALFSRVIYVHAGGECLSKKQQLLWTLYDVFFIVSAILAIILLLVLSFFVLRMFIISRIWKLLVMVDFHLKDDVLRLEVYNEKLIKKTNSILLYAVGIQKLSQLFRKEYTTIRESIVHYATEILSQKKAPEAYLRELTNCINILLVTE